MLLEQVIQISENESSRYTDNIFVERLWRSIKYKEMYLTGLSDGTGYREILHSCNVPIAVGPQLLGFVAQWPIRV
jgi:hypothetical protein